MLGTPGGGEALPLAARGWLYDGLHPLGRAVDTYIYPLDAPVRPGPTPDFDAAPAIKT